MKFGCCGNMLVQTGVGDFTAPVIKQLGYDYIELPLAPMAQLNEQDFRAVEQNLKELEIQCEVCNILFPPEIKLFSSETSDKQIGGYLNHAFSRAQRLGVQYVVFGSGPSRTVPESLGRTGAWDRLVAITRYIGTVSMKYNITVLIEPLRRQECNIINSVREGLKLAKSVKHPNVKLLVDFFHLRHQQEDPSVILETEDYIKHVHIANTFDRVFPKQLEEDSYQSFIEALKKINYDARISVEAYTNDFEKDALDSLNFLKCYFRW